MVARIIPRSDPYHGNWSRQGMKEETAGNLIHEILLARDEGIRITTKTLRVHLQECPFLLNSGERKERNGKADGSGNKSTSLDTRRYLSS